MAPEVLQHNYTLSSELWSIGIIAYSLLTGRFPYDGENEEEMLEDIMTTSLEFFDEEK